MLKIAIIGRPNVGKSALFNRISEKKYAIVDEHEGVTRDRIYARATFGDHTFELIDSGGIDFASKDPFGGKIIEQARAAIDEASVILFVVDGKVGVTKLDQEVARELLKAQKPVFLLVNKVDTLEDETLTAPFYTLGIPRLCGVSALTGRGVPELLEEALPPTAPLVSKPSAPPLKIAILGRPNVGKSTLANAFFGSERVIVSPVAGTTRDAIDIPCTIDGKEYLFIDTAGVRRKKKEKEKIDYLSSVRTAKALERADICLLLANAPDGFTQEEKKLASEIAAAKKGCILLFNKWDLVKGFRMEHCVQGLTQETPFLADYPLHFISAQTQRNLDKILNSITDVAQGMETKLTTSQVNKTFRKAFIANSPPLVQHRRLILYYATQVSVNPPKFLLFVNHPSLMSLAYKRYLINHLRNEFSFAGVPIEILMRGKPQKTNSDDA